MKAHIVEVFSSIQGEGPIVGCRQIFIRLSGCNLQCNYCDTPQHREMARTCQVETEPGTNKFTEISNPIDAQSLWEIVSGLNLRIHHSISITGGEPLVNYQFIKEFLKLKPKQIKVYLETNGTLPDALAEVIALVDIIGMDIKLPSVTGEHPVWALHKEFLRIANQTEVFVKTVVGPNTDSTEVLATAELIADINHKIPLVLQPLSIGNKVAQGLSPQTLLKWQGLASNILADVRVIPQTHKMLGQL